MYVSYPKLVHPLYFSPFYLSPLLMVISTGLKVLYSFSYRKYFNHVHLHFLLSPSPPINVLPLTESVFHSCPSLFGCMFIIQWNFCFGIIPVHALCSSHCNLLHCTSSHFSPYPVLLNSF
jgi:hypothetical protein